MKLIRSRTGSEAAQRRIAARALAVCGVVTGRLSEIPHPDERIPVRFPFKHVRGIVESAISPRQAEIVCEGNEVAAGVKGQLRWIGQVSNSGEEAIFETNVSPAAYLKGLVLGGEVLNDLVRLNPKLAGKFASTDDAQLDQALFQVSLATLRRIFERAEQPPLALYEIMRRVYALDMDAGQEAEFCGLWRQWRRDSGLVGPRKAVADEPIFTAALIERAVGALDEFVLRPEVLPVDSTWDWLGLGGAGIDPAFMELAFFSEWQYLLAIQAAILPGRAFSFELAGS